MQNCMTWLHLSKIIFFRIIEALAGCYSCFTPRAVKLNYTKLMKCSHYYLLFHECCYRFQPHDFVNHPLRGVDSVHLQMQPLKSSNISNVNSNSIDNFSCYTHTHTHPFNGPFSRTIRVSRYQKGKTIWILLKQETVSGSGIRWAICKSAHRYRQITTPAPHHSVFYRPDALPAAQPTASKH